MVKQWINNCHTRYKNLIRLGAGKDQARMAAGSSKGPLGFVQHETAEDCLVQSLSLSLRNRVSLDSWISLRHWVRLHELLRTDLYARWCGRVKAVASPIPIVTVL